MIKDVERPREAMRGAIGICKEMHKTAGHGFHDAIINSWHGLNWRGVYWTGADGTDTEGTDKARQGHEASGKFRICVAVSV